MQKTGLRRLGGRFGRNSFLWFRYIPAAAVCFVFAFMLVCAPARAKSGVSDGLEMCMRIVIPSLFPFLLLSSLIVSSGLHIKIGRLFGRITLVLFRQPESAAGIIIMSMIGGLPVGAKMTAQIYENGELTTHQAQRLVLFCVNAGPAFIISAVGGSLLGSYKAGAIIYASLVLSSLLLGFLTRFIPESDGTPTLNAEFAYTQGSFFTSLTKAADSAARSMVSICVWIVTFSCVLSLLQTAQPSQKTSCVAAAFLEVTQGCSLCSSRVPIPVIAGIIGWAGLSAHCQILSSIVQLHIKLKYFFSARVINGALAAVICQQLMRLFPVEVAAMLTPSGALASPFTVSPPISIGLLLMCATLLLGEGFKIRQRGEAQGQRSRTR